MAAQIINGVKVGSLKSGRMYAETPSYNEAFKRCMNSINAEWKIVGGVKMWVFDAERADYVREMAAKCYAPAVTVPAGEPKRTDKEAFAVAMGLGIRSEQDLND